MTRQINNKDLINTTLATSYGGWMYCTKCNKNIGYLCYVTYDRIELNFECNCGSKGSILLDFLDSTNGKPSKKSFITIKNRYCCPEDESPLITILNKNIKSYNLKIICKSCGHIYTEKNER